MKTLKIATVLLVICLCLMSVSALAMTEIDARAIMVACHIGDPVADSDNLMGISLKDVHLEDDGDIYVQWQFSNDIMTSNMGYAFTQIRFFDSTDLSTPYAAYTINEDGTAGLTFKEGDSITFLDYAHLKKDEFTPDSGVFFMYFNGSGEGAPAEFYTLPLVFTFYIDDDGVHAVETTPCYAPEEMISAFNG